MLLKRVTIEGRATKVEGSKYSDKLINKARHLLADGEKVEDVSAALGIPERTLYDWRAKWRDDEDFAALRAKKDEEIDELMNRILAKSLKGLEEKIDNGEANVATLNAIAGTQFDKRQLLRGGNTANVGVKGIEELLKKAAADSNSEF